MIRLSKCNVDFLMLHSQFTKENMNNNVPVFLYSLLMSFWLRCEMIDAQFMHQKPSYSPMHIFSGVYLTSDLQTILCLLGNGTREVHLSNTKQLLLLYSCWLATMINRFWGQKENLIVFAVWLTKTFIIGVLPYFLLGYYEFFLTVLSMQVCKYKGAVDKYRIDAVTWILAIIQCTK